MCIFIEINLKSYYQNRDCKVILGNIYRPPRSNVDSLNAFCTSLEQFTTNFQNYKEIILTGDFNLDLLKINENDHINAFLNTLLSNGFFPKITLPTRITDHSQTLIDNCFARSLKSYPDTTSGILLQNISDHQSYFICFDYLLMFDTTKSPYVKVQTNSQEAMADFKNTIKETCLINKFSQIGPDPNVNYNLLNNLLQNAIDKHLPTKLVKLNRHKHKKSAWITQGIIHSIRFRDTLYKRIKNTSDNDEIYQTLKINLKTYNRMLKKTIRAAKIKYYNQSFKNCGNDIKKTWNLIKEVTTNAVKSKTFPKTFMTNNIPCSNKQTIANDFNKYYVNIGSSLASKITQPSNITFSSYLTKEITTNFSFTNVTEEQVVKIISDLKPKTSSGLDNLSNKVLKLIKEEIAPILKIIINQSIETGIFPEKLKDAKVLPIYKKGDNYLFENYRPISLLSSVSKVFERVMHNQLYNYFDLNNLFYINQYGFRKQHSTELAALDLLDRIACAVDHKNVPLSIFLDLSKAFDTLDHTILLNKLNYYGIQGNALKLFESYLCQRKQLVIFNEIKSEKLNIKTGVPQGSIMGPLLFIIYLNDLANACIYFKPIIYADDTALTSTLEIMNFDNVTAVRALNIELSKISDWFKTNKLSLNCEKTKAMLFHVPQKQVNIPNLFIDSSPITFVKDFNYLGITLDTGLTWKPHLNNISKKLAKTNGIMTRLKHFLSVNILKILYNSLILPYLNYGILAWGIHANRLFKM